MGNKRYFVMIFNCIMIIAAITSATMFGIFGYGRPKGPQHFSLYDFNVFYLAGKTWLNGLNAYDATTACKQVIGLWDPKSYNFAYPPHSALLFMLLSAPNFENSKLLLIILNIFCMIGFVYICLNIYKLSSERKQFFLLDFKSSLLISIIVGNSFIANILWVGQTSIILSTALLASYYFYIRSREIRSGILLAFALMKPQLAFTFLLWLLLEKKWKTLTASIISVVILSIVPIYNRGIITSIHDWMLAMNNYLRTGNSEGAWNLFGIQSTLYDLGFQVSSPIIFICSILLVLIIHQFVMKINIFNLLGILAIIGFLFGQAAHQYDIIIIIASILPYYLRKISKKDFINYFFFFLTIVAINFPRKLLFLSDNRILHHHREIILIIVLLFQIVRREERQSVPI
ncbi:MAG: DUF2029 domain-containing protein [Deltaproteobacteria bacterium]|nr:DUF2029 domain-containing protein [Deltaproteobacteria bacterium]